MRQRSRRQPNSLIDAATLSIAKSLIFRALRAYGIGRSIGQSSTFTVNSKKWQNLRLFSRSLATDQEAVAGAKMTGYSLASRARAGFDIEMQCGFGYSFCSRSLVLSSQPSSRNSKNGGSKARESRLKRTSLELTNRTTAVFSKIRCCDISATRPI
jgi:hypothetical protein